MSSGSKHTAGVTILATFFAFAVSSDRPHRSQPVHLAVPRADPATPLPSDAETLRVCSDPNNLPFSNERGEGFENQIAQTVARDLGKTVTYFWHPQRRGFLRRTLLSNACDVVIGVPASLGGVRVTRPYYRSSYVFVTRHDRRLTVRSFDDKRLRVLRIGIPITGDDYDNPPPAQALAVRHIADNVRGYPVFGDYSRPHPSSGAVDAVRRGEADVAIAWGPIAGFAARQAGAPLDLTPVPERDGSVPFSFDIAMAVRPQDRMLASALEDVIARREVDFDRILQAYGVPLTKPILHGRTK